MVNERWREILSNKNHSVNIAAVPSIEGIKGDEALLYTERTLEIFDRKVKGKIGAKLENYIRTALQWCEVAKGGTDSERKRWEEYGLPLEIHNLSSAEIYRLETKDNYKDAFIVYTLIKTHGLIGQAIQGEVNISASMEVLNILQFLTQRETVVLLNNFNQCIIEGVSENLWCEVSSFVSSLICAIVYDRDFKGFNASYRVSHLFPDAVDNGYLSRFFEEKIFPYFQLWYATAALNYFRAEEIKQIFTECICHRDVVKAQHINFGPMMRSIHYDYEGKRHLNVYKQRVIERYLESKKSEHVKMDITVRNNTMYVDFKFSPACEKMIDFCVEAERSGLLTYEKAIVSIYDMFGFRRDKFDRLNNESSYLSVMNEANSTKASIVDFVTGEKVIDVGSGGGVMLDFLERAYPEKTIIGTDISENVLCELNSKKKQEGHSWSVLNHNFVDGPLPEKADTIIFSSILHEIYSYTDGENGKFDIHSVEKAVRNACNSLNPGGRIIIRDGVKTSPVDDKYPRIIRLKFKTPEGVAFFNNFAKDFKGCKDVVDSNKYSFVTDDEIDGDVNFMREFLFTYTWGKNSYAHEVQEQFGYWTLKEAVKFLESCGMSVKKANAFLEPGYTEHLSPLVDIFHGQNNVSLPNSNMFIVVEKK